MLLSPYIPGVALVTGGWVILGRLVDTHRQTVALNRDLERRVDEKHRELEANYRRVARLERQHAVAEERERLMREWAEQAMEPQPIYFPPAPPVLEAPLPGVGLYSDEVVRALAPYVAEPFYAPLSTRLAEEDLGRRARARLDAYQREKTAALAHLRAVLERARSQSGDVRRETLAAWGVEQAATLAASFAAQPHRWAEFRTRLHANGQFEPKPLVLAAIALGWSEKWRAS